MDDAGNITILKRQSAAMPVVCSCQSCRCYRYLQQEKSTLSSPIREVRNEKELTKSSSVIDPAALLSPTSNRWTRREGQHPPGRRTTAAVVLAAAAAVIAGKWADAGSRAMKLLYHRHARSAHAVVTDEAIVFRAPAHARGGRRWSQ